MNKQKYIFEYLNENEFNKKEKTIKKYNMLAYKKLLFEYYNELKNGNFVGVKVSTNSKENTETYELPLPTDEISKKVHSEIKLHYTVYLDKKIVLLLDITPKEILEEAHKAELSTYKGVLISESNAEKDMFKVNLLHMLNK